MLPPTLNYIGSKLMLMDWLEKCMTEYMGRPLGEVDSFADPFSGTGVVALMAIRRGVPTVMTNDIQYFAYVMSSVWTTQDVSIPKLRRDCELFNEVNPSSREGYITKTYATDRGYFTRENAQKIDYIRQMIQSRYDSGEYTYNEFKTLLKLLLYASVAVANVSSTFGAYLKEFKASAKRAVMMDPGLLSMLVETTHTTHTSFNQNVMDLRISAEVVYIDSPYNRRRYDKNYFVLEAIARYDNAEARGKTGVLVNTHAANALFCSTVTVYDAFSQLLENIICRFLFISYSTESLLGKDTLKTLLENAGYGDVQVIENTTRRFKSHQNVTRNVVTEYLFCCTRRTG